MVKKFNEYVTDEFDRSDWPDAPEIKSDMTEKEKLYAIIDIYYECDRGRISLEEMFNKIGSIVGPSRNFPGSIKF